MANKFIVARNDWAAQRLMKRIYQGRVERPERFLHSNQHAACQYLQKLPPMKREDFSVYKVPYYPERLHRG